jgi:ABC-2 type transport system permease protein
MSSSNLGRVVFSTAWKDLVFSYRVWALGAFALRFFWPITTLASAYLLYEKLFGGYLGTLFRAATGTSDYISFVAIGNALYIYTFSVAFVVGRTSYWEMRSGVLDAVLLTPVNRFLLMTGHILAGITNATIDFIFLLLISIPFGLRFGNVNFFTFGIGFALTLLAMYGFALFINTFTLYFRDRTNTSNTLVLLFYAFSGVICPVNLLPSWAQTASTLIPLTYGNTLVRAALTQGTAPLALSSQIMALTFLAGVYLLLGVASLRFTERDLKKTGKYSVY